MYNDLNPSACNRKSFLFSWGTKKSNQILNMYNEQNCRYILRETYPSKVQNKTTTATKTTMAMKNEIEKNEQKK